MNDLDFLELLEGLETGAPQASEQEINRTCRLAMRRAGMRRHPRRLLLLAAALAAAGVLAAAAYYSVSGAFSGLLRESKPDGSAGPVARLASVVDQTGSLPGVSDTENGVTVSLRAVVGTAEHFKMILDVEGPEGRPLALKEEDGSYSGGPIKFELADLAYSRADAKSGSGNLGASMKQMPDGDPLDNRLSFLFEGSMHYSSDGENGRENDELVGVPLKLELKNLRQVVSRPGDDIGLKYRNLRELCAQFPAITREDFTKTPAKYNRDGKVTGYHYELEPKEHGIAVSDKYPTLKLSRAGLYNDKLYLCGTVDAKEEKAINELALKRLSDGELLKADGLSKSGGYSRRNGPGSGPVTFTLTFKSSEPGEEYPDYRITDKLTTGLLEQFTLVSDAGSSPRILAKGHWTLPFEFVSTPRTQRVARPGREITLEGITAELTEMKLTPLALSLSLRPGERALQEIEARIQSGDVPESDGWPCAKTSARLHGKDGTVVEARLKGAGSTGLINAEFWFETVLDPAGIESVELEGQILPFEDASGA